MVALQFVTSADQEIIATTRDHDHIVCHEPVPTLDEVEYAFTFADPATSHEEQADTIDIGQ
jgi:hypothetical protein